MPTSCEDKVIETLTDLQRNAELRGEGGREAYFNAAETYPSEM